MVSTPKSAKTKVSDGILPMLLDGKTGEPILVGRGSKEQRDYALIRNRKTFEQEYADVTFTQTEDAFGKTAKAEWTDGRVTMWMALEVENGALVIPKRSDFETVWAEEATPSYYRYVCNFKVPSINEAKCLGVIIDRILQTTDRFRPDEVPEKDWPKEFFLAVLKLRGIHSMQQWQQEKKVTDNYEKLLQKEYDLKEQLAKVKEEIQQARNEVHLLGIRVID